MWTFVNILKKSVLKKHSLLKEIVHPAVFTLGFHKKFHFTF